MHLVSTYLTKTYLTIRDDFAAMSFGLLLYFGAARASAPESFTGALP
jgi:hypothetical protein